MDAAPEIPDLAGPLCAARERWGIPGIALGVLENGRTRLWADGVASVETGTAVEPSTPFRIASITKPFVATLTLTLVEQGLLGLDDELGPGLAIRRLLAHRGGLACEWPVPPERYGCGDDALARLAADPPEPLPVPPGDLYSYCNVGYWLVGAAVAAAAGTTFEEAMAARVLEPLGLARTGFAVPVGGAVGHAQVAPGSRRHRALGPDVYPRARRPSGGLWSTAGDLLRFAAHHLGGPGPSAASSIEAMQTPESGTSAAGYGLGWMLREAGGAGVVEHAGSAAGYQSLLLLVPERRLALAVLTNSARGSAAIQELLRELGLASPPPALAELRDDELEAFAGRYAIQNLEARVEVAGEGLAVETREVDPITGEVLLAASVQARPTGPRSFAVVDGEHAGETLDFPRPGLGRFGGVVAPRVPA